MYVGLAFFLSFPVQRGLLDPYLQPLLEGSLLNGSTYLFAGFSTVIAALVAMAFHKNLSGRIKIIGDEKIKNLLILSLPVLVFSTIGLQNDLGVNKSLYAFVFASTNTLYAFAEEYGWRRYLQNALEGMNKHIKYLLIGVIWWLWHFRFDSQFDLFIFPLICLGGAYFLGKLADDLKTILPVVMLHTLIILTSNTGRFGKNEVIGIVIVILAWIFIEQIWKRRKRLAYQAQKESPDPIQDG